VKIAKKRGNESFLGRHVEPRISRWVLNTDGERGLKYWAKMFAVTAQKRSDEVFSGQVVARIHASELLVAITGSGYQRETTAALEPDEVEVHFSGDNFSILVGQEETKAIRTLPNVGTCTKSSWNLIKLFLISSMGNIAGLLQQGRATRGLRFLKYSHTLKCGPRTFFTTREVLFSERIQTIDRGDRGTIIAY
jgi:hypothetical protein